MAGARVMLLVLLATAGLAPAAPAAQGLGAIYGRVSVPNVPQTIGPPSIADLRPASRMPVDRSTAVVYLESAPRRAFEDVQPGRARMDQRNEQFVPRILAITVGTAVEFTNTDRTFHNVFSLSRVRTFDLGRYPPGKSGTIVFNEPGIVPVFCDIHSRMSAYILVFSHPFFATSGANGRYEIGGVPAGQYSLEVWSELGEATPRPVTVKDGERSEVNFEVRAVR